MLQDKNEKTIVIRNGIYVYTNMTIFNLYSPHIVPDSGFIKMQLYLFSFLPAMKILAFSFIDSY